MSTATATASPSSALFIGQVARAGQRRAHTVRIWTDGSAPGPDAEVEAIEDPFRVARESDDPKADARALARALPQLDDGPRGPLSQHTVLAPVRPGKIVCVGRNYRAHARELGNEVPTEPLLFFKPSSSLVGSGAAVILPRGYERIDLEGELVIVIGCAARNIAEDGAWSHVAGCTLGNDVSCRDLQKRDGQWTRAKGFDTFAPLGPFVRVFEGGELVDAHARIQSFVDDARCQDAPVGDMIFPVPTLLAYISACMTLEPGDLVFTGTPQGVTSLRPGQIMRVETQGLDLGRLTNPIV